MDSGSDSDQDSACSSSGEDTPYNQLQSLTQQQNSNASQAVADYHSLVAAQMKYMQQQQQGDQSRQQDDKPQQQPMMLPANCMSFMPGGSSFPLMMQSGAMSSFFSQNATSSPSSRESEAATGSPLNLQTSREDRPSSRSLQAPVDYQNQSMAQPFTHDHQALPPAARGHQVANSSQSSLSRSSPQSGLPCSLPNTMSMNTGHLGLGPEHQRTAQAQTSAGNFSLDFSAAAVAQRQDPPKQEQLAPPKRPLTPYMRFSKCMWQQVKTSNPGMSVCEIGATIGRMWRELSAEEKQKHNDEFTQDKVRYDNELKSYLKSTGLHASDLVKSKNKKKEVAKASIRRPAPPPHQPRPAVNVESQQQASNQQQQQQQQQQQLAQSFIGLPIPGMGGSLPMGVGMPMGMLPGFPQMWAAPGQQYPSQQMLASMNMAGQLQFAQQQAQGLYNNGATTLDQGSAAGATQLTPGTEGQMPPVYLYSSQNFM